MAGRSSRRTQHVILANGREYDIPVDEDGYVPVSKLLERFESGEGVSDGKTFRDPVKDYDERADVVLPEKLTPRQAAIWWDRPAEYDIEGIDAPGRPKIRKGMKFYGTEAEATRMSVLVDGALNRKEREKLTKSGLSYTARPMHPGTAGWYDGEGVSLSREKGMEVPVVAHESAHAMRARDRSRDNRILLTEAEKIGVEESCTVAESQARSSTPAISGYYLSVPVFDEKTRRWRQPTEAEALRMAKEDHQIFTYGRGKGLKGEDALRSVEENWADSHIARLRTSPGGWR